MTNSEKQADGENFYGGSGSVTKIQSPNPKLTEASLRLDETLKALDIPLKEFKAAGDEYMALGGNPMEVMRQLQERVAAVFEDPAPAA